MYSETFHLVKNSENCLLVNILKSRLPRSGHVYNMAIMLDNYPAEMKAYILNGLKSVQESIIMIIFKREDYGQDINVSIPNDFRITDEIKDAFTASKEIDWQGPHLFTAVDRKISRMIFEISTLTYRNSVIFNPNFTYASGPDDPSSIKLEEKAGVVIKRLDTEVGLKFMMDNWRYSKSGAEVYLRKVIEKSITAGVYKDGVLVSGAVVNAHGLIGVLGTPPQYRKNGYATMCMQFLIREMAKNGFVPMSSAQQENWHSLKLHEKLGMEVSHESDYIFHIPYLKTD